MVDKNVADFIALKEVDRHLMKPEKCSLSLYKSVISEGINKKLRNLFVFFIIILYLCHDVVDIHFNLKDNTNAKSSEIY
jgi:hypothetical protein